MNKAQKQITLPASGGVCLVRKIHQRDFISAGMTPLFLNFANEKRRTALTEAGEEKLLEAMTEFTEVMLLKCCGKITFPDGSVQKIVKKPFDECAPEEIALEVLEQADATAIVDAVQELSGMTKGAAEAAKSFPEGQSNDSEPAPSGEVLRGSADNATGPNAV